jgi:Zn finger protein HypA/HybF involved in hydrogenase expression
VPTDYDNDLLREGIFRYRVKEYDLARKYLERALENADDLQTRAQANYYLSLLTDDPVRKHKYLEETLAIDMTHPEARRLLAILDGRLKPDQIVDPDALPARAAGPVAVQTRRFTCPKCGGRMVYAPNGVELVCEYCSRNQRLSTTPSLTDQDFFVAMANGTGQRRPSAVQTFRCQGCGANFILAPDEISATCAYCGSVHVVASDEKRQMVAPDSILPMTIDRSQALQQLAQWLEDRNLPPQSSPLTPRGLYLPVWSFDIQGNFPWNGVVTRNKRQVPVSGEKVIQFNDILILGSKKLADLAVQALPDFDLGYATSGLMVSTFHFILVPVWVADIAFRERSERVLINGRNGTVHGQSHKGGLTGWLENVFAGRTGK